MAAPVKWTRAATRDFDAAVAFIAQDSPGNAAAFAQRVRDASRAIASFPESGGIVPEFNSPTFREVFVDRFRLIYQFDGNRVHFLLCIHSSRDLIRALEGRLPAPDMN